MALKWNIKDFRKGKQTRNRGPSNRGSEDEMNEVIKKNVYQVHIETMERVCVCVCVCVCVRAFRKNSR